MAQAEHSIEVDLPREDFYRLVTDFEAYPTFLSDVKAARVISHKGQAWEASFVARVVKDIDYTLRLVGKPPAGLSWSLVQSSVMTANDGYWKLDDLGSGRTRATYAVALTLSRFVPSSVTRMLVQARLPAMLQEWAVHARNAREAAPKGRGKARRP